MKKKRVYHTKSEILKKYLLSDFIILWIITIFFLCVTIWYTVEGLRREERRVTENRLNLIAEDLELQMENMQQIAMEIATRPAFRPNSFLANKYYEIELLEYLKTYQYSVNLCDHLFLKYKDIDNVFLSEGSTLPLKVYYNNIIGKEGYEDFQNFIESSGKAKGQRVIPYVQDDVIMFLYPLSNYGGKKTDREGVLCAVMKEKDFFHHFASITGEMQGEFTIYYKGSCILAENTKFIVDSIYVTSSRGNFEIYFRMADNGISLFNVIDLKTGMIFAGTMILMILIVYMNASLKFRPIDSIIEKYKAVNGYHLDASWESIDGLIDFLVQGKERTDKILKEQYQIMKKQIIQLILSGKYNNNVQEHITLFGIKLDAPVYGIIEFKITDPTGIKLDERALMHAIETLSEESVILFPYIKEDGTGVYILATAEESFQLEVVLELLDCLAETYEMQGSFEILGVFHDLKEIRQNYIKKTKHKNLAKKETAEYGQVSVSDRKAEKCEQVKVSGRKENVDRIIKYIENNYTDENLSLDLISQEFGKATTYLCRIIKQESGKNYKDYLIELRMEKAKKIFCEQDISVAEVCKKVGYTNVPHFIKMFQKYTGVTPARYKELNYMIESKKRKN